MPPQAQAPGACWAAAKGKAWNCGKEGGGGGNWGYQERGAEHGLIQGWAIRAGKATWAMAKALHTKMPAGMVVASPLLADSPHRQTSTWVQCIRRARRRPRAAARRT